MALGLRHKPTLKYGILNWLISHSNPERFGTKGKTETGMLFHNLPKKLVPLSVEKAETERDMPEEHRQAKARAGHRRREAV